MTLSENGFGGHASVVKTPRTGYNLLFPVQYQKLTGQEKTVRKTVTLSSFLQLKNTSAVGTPFAVQAVTRSDGRTDDVLPAIPNPI